MEAVYFKGLMGNFLLDPLFDHGRRRHGIRSVVDPQVSGSVCVLDIKAFSCELIEFRIGHFDERIPIPSLYFHNYAALQSLKSEPASIALADGSAMMVIDSITSLTSFQKPLL